jgi:hypothetical protein
MNENNDNNKAVVYTTAKIENNWPLSENINEVKQLAEEKNDPNAKAILELYDNVKNEAKKLLGTEESIAEKFKKLNEERNDFKNDLRNYKGELRKVNNFLIAVLLFVSITFIATTLSLFWSGILSDKNDKELYLKYNDTYKNYSDQNNKLNDIVNQQKIEINNFKNEADILKAKNPFLK